MKLLLARLCLPTLWVGLLANAGVAQDRSAIRADVQRMDEVVRFYADDPPRAFMGVVLVGRGADVLFAKGYGMANLEWSVPHTLMTRMPIGSNSKQFTAAAILLLEERGKLRVTDPIKSYFSDAPAAWDAITFHHLLSHTSGLTPGTPPGAAAALPARPEKTLERFRNLPLQSAPGTTYRYSNAGYQLLAYMVERISGQRYEDFLRENIFEALGMQASGSATHAPIIPSLASGYEKAPGGALLHAPFLDLSNGMGAGSLYSTVGDLHRWTLGLFGGKLLSPASLTKMTTQVVSTPQGPGSQGGYGYGLIARTSSDGRREFYHGGSVPGFSSVLSYYPDSQITVVVLNNLRGQSDERRAPPIIAASWLGTLAHGGTVTLPTKQ